MTSMGIEYQKHLENMRHNLATEGLTNRDVRVREFTASFEPRKVAATELGAQSQARNANTNAYIASFKPREVAVAESQAESSARQASASLMQGQAALRNAATNEFNALLNKTKIDNDIDVSQRRLLMDQIYNMKDVELRQFQNETNRLNTLVTKAYNEGRLNNDKVKMTSAFTQSAYAYGLTDGSASVSDFLCAIADSALNTIF